MKELAWLRAYGRPRFPFERAYRESTNYRLSDPSEHIALLEFYLKIAPELLPPDEFLRPVLRHPDLQPNNIFVSDDFDIVGLIDWQHASVLPVFLAAGIPKFFQNYDDPESLYFRPPPTPDLDDMDEEKKPRLFMFSSVAIPTSSTWLPRSVSMDLTSAPWIRLRTCLRAASLLTQASPGRGITSHSRPTLF